MLAKNRNKHDNERVRLTVCDEEKDLGVIFDKNLKFDKQVESSVQKANKMLGIIKRSFTYLDEDMFLRLYKSLIRLHSSTVKTSFNNNNNKWGFIKRSTSTVIAELTALTLKT
jgi:hypothetical protein